MPLLEEVRILVSNFHSLSLMDIYRETNLAADPLPKEGLHLHKVFGK